LGHFAEAGLGLEGGRRCQVGDWADCTYVCVWGEDLSMDLSVLSVVGRGWAQVSSKNK
jgi:hypothetical protein